MKGRWVLVFGLCCSAIAVCLTWNQVWSEHKKTPQDLVNAFKTSYRNHSLWSTLSSTSSIANTNTATTRRSTRAPSSLILKKSSKPQKATASRHAPTPVPSLASISTTTFSPSTRYLYIEQSGGFTHNQLNTFSAAFRLSRAWERKLVLPFPSGGKQWMGWLEHETDVSPWDLSHLHQHFDFTDVVALTRMFGNYSDVLQLPVPQGCIVGYNRYLDGSKIRRFNDCHTVLVEGVQMVDTSKLGVPLYAFFEHLRVSKLIMQTAQQFVKSVKWQEPFVGVHHRTWCENSETTYAGRYNKSYEVCSGMLKRWIYTWKQISHPSLHSQLPQLFDNCLRTPQTLERMLATTLPTFELGKGPFFFSTDRQFLEIDEPFKKLGAIEYDFAPFEKSAQFQDMLKLVRSDEFKARSKLIGEYQLNGEIFKQMYRGLIDATILVLSDFFVAHPMSSMSWSVCLWRGPHRANMSNFCELFVKLNTVK